MSMMRERVSWGIFLSCFLAVLITFSSFAIAQTGTARLEIAPLTSKSAIIGSELAFKVQAVGPYDAIRYYANGLPPTARLDMYTGEFKWVPTESTKGEYEVEFIVTDGLLKATKKIIISTAYLKDIPIYEEGLITYGPITNGKAVLYIKADSRIGPFRIMLYELGTNLKIEVAKIDYTACAIKCDMNDKFVAYTVAGTNKQEGDFEKAYHYNMSTGQTCRMNAKRSGVMYVTQGYIYIASRIYGTNKASTCLQVYDLSKVQGDPYGRESYDMPEIVKTYDSRWEQSNACDKKIVSQTWHEENNAPYTNIRLHALDNLEGVNIPLPGKGLYIHPAVYGDDIFYFTGYTDRDKACSLYGHNLLTGATKQYKGVEYINFVTYDSRGIYSWCNNKRVAWDTLHGLAIFDMEREEQVYQKISTDKGCRHLMAPVSICNDYLAYRVWDDIAGSKYEMHLQKMFLYPKITSVQTGLMSNGQYEIVINGANFCHEYNANEMWVKFGNGKTAHRTNIKEWTNNRIILTAPFDATSGKISVITLAGESKPVVIDINNPRAPTGLKAYLTTAPSIALSWQDNSWNEGSFAVYRRKDGEGFKVIATLPANSTGYTDKTAEPGVRYTYNVSSIIPGVWETFCKTPIEVIAPEAPVAAPACLRAVAVGCKRVDLSWKDMSNNAKCFAVYRMKDGEPFKVIAVIQAHLSNGPRKIDYSYPDLTAEPRTHYIYNVSAILPGVYENICKMPVGVTTPGKTPAAPVNQKAAATGKGSITVNWLDKSTTPNAPDNETYFMVYVRVKGQSYFSFAAWENSGKQQTTINGLKSNTTYEIKVSAFTIGGDEVFCVTPKMVIEVKTN